MPAIQHSVGFADVAQNFAASLRRGVSPWQRLSQELSLMPIAGTTGKPFRGINRWVLANKGLSDPRWYTREQAEHLGASLNSEEEGVKLSFWRFSRPFRLKSGEEIREKLLKPELLVFTVFNAESFDGLPKLTEAPRPPCDPKQVSQILKMSGAAFRPTEQLSAFFSPEDDVIYVPPMTKYPSREARLSDVVRELVAWESAPCRQGGAAGSFDPPGSSAFARRSLTCELASLLIESELRLPHNDQKNRAYYADWAALLEKEPTVILQIASEADRLATKILGLVNDRQKIVDAKPKLPLDWSGSMEVSATEDLQHYRVMAVRKDGSLFEVARLDSRPEAETMAWQISVLYSSEARTEREYLHVPYEHRDEVKLLGAKFDPAVKAWFIPPEADDDVREKLQKWRPGTFQQRVEALARETLIRAKDSLPSERIFLNVPFVEKNKAKRAGAVYDARRKVWYVSKKGPLESVQQWLPPEYKELVEKYLPEGVLKEPVKLYVPYEAHMFAKSKGAYWNSAEKSWYAPAGAFEKDFIDWMRMPVEMDPLEEFKTVLRSMGFDEKRNAPVVLDGEKHRFYFIDDKPKKPSGEYRAYSDGRPAGSITNFKSGEFRTWQYAGRKIDISPETYEKLRAEAEAARERRRKETTEKQLNASRRSQLLYESLPAELDKRPITAYEERKGLNIKGARPMVGRVNPEGKLVLPVTDLDGRFWSIQTIDADGSKRFTKDGRKRGCLSYAIAENCIRTAKGYEIGSYPALVVCEGYATAMSVSQALQQPVVIAFDAGNLSPVCAALHAKYPNVPILIAGDDDAHREKKGDINPGRSKALKVQEELPDAVHCVFPVFAPEEAGTKDFTDFNDLASKSRLGFAAMKEQLLAARKALRPAMANYLDIDTQRILRAYAR